MNTQTNPEFKDILSLVESLPVIAPFETNSTDALSWITDWLAHHSRVYDFTKGFNVNRCALYWSGYDKVDDFDGQKFVDSCQDSRGSLRQLAQILDTDLQIFELDPHNHTKPTSTALAMAASYGMMAIDESTQLFCAASFGQGVDMAAKESIEALEKTDNFDLEKFMVDHCGLDHAAILGCAIAATMKGIPMVIEGNVGVFIARLLCRATNRPITNIIATAAMPPLTNNKSVGHDMVTTAILLRMLYIGANKTDCGKVKIAA